MNQEKARLAQELQDQARIAEELERKLNQAGNIKTIVQGNLQEDLAFEKDQNSALQDQLREVEAHRDHLYRELKEREREADRIANANLALKDQLRRREGDIEAVDKENHYVV